MNYFSYEEMQLKRSVLEKKLAGARLTLKILSEDNRIYLLTALLSSALCVSDLKTRLGLSQSLVSHHLRDLRDLELVTFERSGKWIFYSLSDKGKKTLKLITLL